MPLFVTSATYKVSVDKKMILRLRSSILQQQLQIKLGPNKDVGKPPNSKIDLTQGNNCQCGVTTPHMRSLAAQQHNNTRP